MRRAIFILFASICVLFCVSCNGFFTEEEKTTDISDYDRYFGNEGSHLNDIFPKKIPSSAKVEDFCYYYYNPFDPNYVSYLVYTCSAEDYEKEIKRLSDLKSSEEYLIYSATGFNYPVHAVYADDYNGYIYALGDEDNNKLIYIEIYFCNYFSDIDYEDIIHEEYLPINFDAKPDNTTRIKFENGKL